MVTRKAYIYKYQAGEDTPLCIYLCNTIVKGQIVIIPLVNEETEGSIKLSKVNKYADINNYLEVSKDSLISPLYLNSRQVRISNSEFKKICDAMISYLLELIGSNITLNTKDMDAFEQAYRMLNWELEKIQYNLLPYKHRTTVYENGIYMASLGVNVGSEIGKNRPVLIWKKREGDSEESHFSYIVIPITSQKRGKNYYTNIPIDINDRKCFLRIEDMQRISIKRISKPIMYTHTRKIIFIDKEKRKEIKDAIRRFYIFDNQYHKKD